MTDEKMRPTEIKQPTQKKSFRFAWGRIGVLFLILLIIVGMIVASFAYCRLFRFDKELRVAVTSLETQLADSQKQITDLQNNSAAVQQAMQQTMDELKNVNKTVTDLVATQHNNKAEWTVAEAHYLVKLANDNLQFAGNVPLAITLLQMADQQIHDLADPSRDPIRKALAGDIANLQSTPQVDVAGIYLRLSALNEQLDKLPLPNKQTNTSQSNAQASSDQNEVWWQRGLQTTWQSLRQLVVVRYNKSGNVPFMTPDQEAFLFQNVHAMLEHAMWALLHGQADIYRTSLEQTSVWVKQYFVTDSTVTQAVLTELDALQKLNVHLSVPKITNSLQAFQEK